MIREGRNRAFFCEGQNITICDGNALGVAPFAKQARQSHPLYDAVGTLGPGPKL